MRRHLEDHPDLSGGQVGAVAQRNQVSVAFLQGCERSYQRESAGDVFADVPRRNPLLVPGQGQGPRRSGVGDDAPSDAEQPR
jgi:hypothetical protein